jgi:hypothetical protein
VLAELDAARATALGRADPEVLAEVFAPSSPGLAADTRLVGELAAAGLQAHGVRHDVRSVAVLSATADHARLRVVDSLAASELRDSAGVVVRRVAGRGAAAYVVELTRTPDGWRVVEVRSA